MRDTSFDVRSDFGFGPGSRIPHMPSSSSDLSLGIGVATKRAGLQSDACKMKEPLTSLVPVPPKEFLTKKCIFLFFFSSLKKISFLKKKKSFCRQFADL